MIYGNRRDVYNADHEQYRVPEVTVEELTSRYFCYIDQKISNHSE